VQLVSLINFYHGMSPDSVARFPEHYSADACFKDPFNEVQGLPAIQGIFTHMFEQVVEPRFVITEQLAAEGAAMLVWEFRYRAHSWGGGQTQCIRGVSHLKFDGAGKVCYHRDYWDAAEELYMKLPLLGMLMRGLRRMLAA